VIPVPLALPVPSAVPVPVRNESSVVIEIGSAPVRKLRVLFVDDSLSVRKVAERMLLGLGVDVVTAVDGQDALEKLRTSSFSLVFTDLEMPRVHGYELLREMQYLPAYSGIPVVVISSRSGQKHIDQALGLGAREYLTKPFSPEILHAVLARLARKEPPS
jgi:chemosensory pili system protein ChpA (sensor histidine kinase/response regulator)